MAQQEVDIFFKVQGVDGYITDLNELSDALKSVAKEQKDVNDEIEETGKASKKGGGFLTSLGKKGKAAFGALKGAIAATGIGLLLTAFAQLVEWFKKTDAGAKILQGATAALGVIFDRILILLQPIGEILSNLFTNPVESLKNFGNLIKQNIQDRFTALVDGLGFVGEAFKKLFEGDFSGAAEAAGNAFTKIAYEASGLEDVVEGVTSVVNATTEAFEGVGDEINKVIQDTNNLVDANNRFAALQNELLVQNAQLTKDLEEQKKISEDTTRAYDERSEALENVISANEKLVENALLEAQETEKLLKQKLALTKNDEDRRELEAELATATAERIAREQEASIVYLESAQLRRELDQEEVDRKQSINDTLDALRLENVENEEEAAIEGLRIAEEATIRELRLQKASEEQILEAQRLFEEQRNKTRKEYADQRAAEQEQENKEREAREKEVSQNILAAEQSLQDAKLAAFRGGIAAISQLAGENEKIQNALFLVDQAVAAAEVIVNAVREKATNAAYAATLGPAGPAYLVPANAATNIRTGIALATIAATSIAKLKKSKGNTPQDGPPPPSISAGSTPQFQLPTTTQGEDIQLGGGRDAREQPIRAYVVATEVTDAQQANQQIENLSRL
jgi:hypothetical protein